MIAPTCGGFHGYHDKLTFSNTEMKKFLGKWIVQ